MPGAADLLRNNLAVEVQFGDVPLDARRGGFGLGGCGFGCGFSFGGRGSRLFLGRRLGGRLLCSLVPRGIRLVR